MDLGLRSLIRAHAPSELSMVFKWRRVEVQIHYPRVSDAAIGPKGLTQIDLSVIRKGVVSTEFLFRQRKIVGKQIAGVEEGTKTKVPLNREAQKDSGDSFVSNIINSCTCVIFF